MKMTKDKNKERAAEPQGPMRNEQLQDEEYRKAPLPGDDPDVPAGQGSGAQSSPIVTPRTPSKEEAE